MSDAERNHDKPDLEQEKFAFEQSIRERELELREREISRSRPVGALVIALFTAAAAGAANFGISAYNSAQQVGLESVKAEHALVIEAIKTDGDVAKSRANLEFLIGTHLITTEERRKRITEYLSKNNAPTLASAGSSSSGRRYDFAVSNKQPVDPLGWEIDVFSCAKSGEQFEAAKRFAGDVAARADQRAGLGGAKLGEIRFESGQNWRSANQIYFDPNEAGLARNVADAAARTAGRPFALVPNSEEPTPHYLSVYFCGA